MPLYRYVCKKCGHEEVVLQKANETQKPTCEKCGEEMVRSIGKDVSIIFKGSGYKNIVESP